MKKLVLVLALAVAAAALFSGCDTGSGAGSGGAGNVDADSRYSGTPSSSAEAGSTESSAPGDTGKSGAAADSEESGGTAGSAGSSAPGGSDARDSSDADARGSADDGKTSGGFTVDGKGLERLEVRNGVGAIKVSESRGENIEIYYKKEVKGSGAEVKEVAGLILVDAKAEGSGLLVEVRKRDDVTKDFWQWLSENYKALKVSVDLEIKVPENITEYAVRDGVGDISFSGVRGKMNVVAGVGAIRAENVFLTDQSSFTNGTGDISIDSDIKEASALEVQTGVGKISLRLPKDSKFSIDAKTGVGNIKGDLIDNGEGFVAEGLKQEVNGGGTDIRLRTGTGDITVGSN